MEVDLAEEPKDLRVADLGVGSASREAEGELFGFCMCFTVVHIRVKMI